MDYQALHNVAPVFLFSLTSLTFFVLSFSSMAGSHSSQDLLTRHGSCLEGLPSPPLCLAHFDSSFRLSVTSLGAFLKPWP